MNSRRNILSGIAALLMVGTFYSFAFCMVEDVDDQAVPMEYYYSTETDADTGERYGKATSAFDAAAVSERPDSADGVTTERRDEDRYHYKADAEEDSSSGEEESKPVTSPPSKEDNGTGVIPAAPVTENTQEAEDSFPVEDDSLSEDDLSEDYTAPEDNEAEDNISEGESGDAENKNVFADNDVEDELLSKLDTEIIPDSTTAAITEAPGGNTDTITYFGGTVTDRLNETSSDRNIVINVNVPAETQAPSAAASQPAASTFTAKYNGSVHTVDAYDLVCMIVNNEISSYFNDEAIKAQAVAAYSYVKYHNDNGLTPSVIVKSNPPQRIKDMVSAVWGKCCYYKGKTAQTTYTASTSGYTASSENVWGGRIDYLVSVPCPFDAESDPNYGAATKVSKENMRSALESCLGITLSDSPESWLKITGYIDGNYVSEINVDGQKTITGRKLRENVLGYQLKSASFDVTYYDGYFHFTTYGWGHGVGMSQNGADILAGKGYTYDQILKYYYTGIDVL